jgi:ribosomal protein L19E
MTIKSTNDSQKATPEISCKVYREAYREAKNATIREVQQLIMSLPSPNKSIKMNTVINILSTNVDYFCKLNV